MKGPLGFHLEKTLELREETERDSVVKYPAIRTCLEGLRKQLHEFEQENRFLIKLSDTGRVVVAVQRCLETTLDILRLQESDESILWRNHFKNERNEWMDRAKLLLACEQRMKIEIGDTCGSLEILTRLRYGIERYGDALTPEEMDVMSDVFDAVVHRSNSVVVGIPRWFATSKYDWFSSKTTPVPGTDGQIYHGVNLWVDLHHPHVRKFFGACHVGKDVFVIHDRSFRIYEFGVRWKELLGCAHGLEYVHGCGLVHLNLTVSDLLLSMGTRGILSGLGLVRRSKVNWSSKTNRLLNKQQPSPERDILSFGLCIFALLDGIRNRSYRRLATKTTKLIRPPKQLPMNRPQSVDEEEWELLRLMCSSNEVDRIGIRDVIYRMKLLADHENSKASNNDNADAADRMEVVEELSLFMVHTLGLTLGATLGEVEQVCDELTDFSAVNQPVLSRVKDFLPASCCCGPAASGCRGEV